jgi:pyruvate,water dikinase
VVGTGNAGERISTGDRIRVNGATGVVELLA